LDDLPGVEELKAAGLLDSNVVQLGAVAPPSDDAVLPEPMEEEEIPAAEPLSAETGAAAGGGTSVA